MTTDPRPETGHTTRAATLATAPAIAMRAVTLATEAANDSHFDAVPAGVKLAQSLAVIAHAQEGRP